MFFFYLFAHQVTSQALFVPGPASYEADEEWLHWVEPPEGPRLAAYWGPAPGATRTVVYFHGNAEDLGDARFVLDNYRLQGVNALSFDYRGYGLSEGHATEANSYADARAVLDYAVANWGVDPDRVVFHGRSLGAGVALQLATERPVAGLVLESAFLSAFRVYLPLKWIPGDKFVNAKKAPRVGCPTLVVHGKQDQVVPFEHGEELAALLPPGRVKSLFLEGAGHNDLASGAKGAAYWSGLRGFLAGL